MFLWGFFSSFQKHGVHGLSQLAEVSDSTLQKVTASDYTLNDYTYIKASVQDLSTEFPSYQQIKDYKPAGLFLKHIWNFGKHGRSLKYLYTLNEIAGFHSYM